LKFTVHSSIHTKIFKERGKGVFKTSGVMWGLGYINQRLGWRFSPVVMNASHPKLWFMGEVC
jgi:hypothetical protein